MRKDLRILLLSRISRSSWMVDGEVFEIFTYR